MPNARAARAAAPTIDDCVAELPTYEEKSRKLQRRVVGDGASCLVGYASTFGKGLGVRWGGGPDPPYPSVISYHIISFQGLPTIFSVLKYIKYLVEIHSEMH